MRSRTARLVVVVVAVLVAVALFLVLRDDGAPEQAPPEPEPTNETAPAEDPQESEPSRPPTIRIVDGELRGEPLELDVSSGDAIHLRIESDTPGEVHVHGYEIFEDVEAETPADLRFDADIEGAFELEFHRATDDGHVEVATLNVHPT